jgi:ankyrin repeat protein
MNMRHNGFTCLHTACKKGHVHIVEYLLENYSSPSPSSPTPLHVSDTADDSKKETTTTTPTHSGGSGGSSSGSGSDSSREGGGGKGMAVAETEMDVCEQLTGDGRTALMVAAFEGHIDILRALHTPLLLLY